MRNILIYTLVKGLSEIEKCLSQVPDNRRYISAIAGGSGAGKSRLAEYLASKNPRISRFSLDDYFIGPINLPKGVQDCDSPGRYDLPRVNFDLKALKSNCIVEKPTYDKATHKHGREIFTLRENSILLVEGLYALNEMIRREADFGIFVRADEDIRLKRRLKRDIEAGIPREVAFNIWETAKLVYYKEIAPTEYSADLIINNDAHSELLKPEQAEQLTPKTF